INDTTTTPNHWSVTLPVGAGSISNALQSGTSYYIVSLSTDIASNAEFGALAANIPSGVGVTITYDTATPTTVITTPNYSALPAAKALESIGAISGTASGDTGIQRVDIALVKNGATPLRFNGANNFNQSSPNSFTVSGTTNWTYDPGPGTLATLMGVQGNHSQFTIAVRAVSPSNLTQSVFALGASSFPVTIDTTAPTAAITPLPVNGISYQPANSGQGTVPGPFLGGSSSDAGPQPSG